MSYYELEQDKAIRQFLKDFPEPTKDNLFILFHSHFIYPDIETEFLNKVAKNAIDVSYDYFISLPKTKRFHFLRALGKLIDSALSLKIWEFQLSRNDAKWYWKGTPTYFLALTHLVEPLESLRHEMGLVKRKHLYEKIVCVEGESELSFIRTMYLTAKYANFDFPVYSYRGKGEIQNLIHFIKEKNRQGIRVLLSYDMDRQSDSFIKNIKKKCVIEKTFGFNQDFESSFPPKILKYSLDSYIKRYTKLKISLNEKDVADLLTQQKPFLKIFSQKYNVKINKVKFGEIMGKIMAGILYQHWNDVFNKPMKAPFNYEIFKFLKYLVT